MKSRLKQVAVAAVLSLCVLISAVVPVFAQSGQVLGIHIMSTHDFDQAEDLLKSSDRNEWHYLTIPLTLGDVQKHEEWQTFFDKAREAQLIPIVRLATRAEGADWQVPNRKEMTDLIGFLSTLDWPTSDRYIIVLNETNHAKEFGGSINPEKYAEILRFTSQWARSEDAGYKVLPAAMDLAAPNGSETMEAFTYLDRMVAYDKDIFSHIDYLNSHAYPNPGFSASPSRKGQNSLEGFKYELSYLKEKTGKDFEVFITETGWIDNASTGRWLSSYYQYALQHVWSDKRVKAVTPFILQGSPGPFAGFSFLDAAGKPTRQYLAFQKLL